MNYNLVRIPTRSEIHYGHMIESKVLKKGDLILRDGSKTITKEIGSTIHRYIETYVTEKVISTNKFIRDYGNLPSPMNKKNILLADTLIGDRRFNDENELPNSAFENIKKGY